MKLSIISMSIAFTLALGAAIPKSEKDADAAVVYPASIDLSWVDAEKKVKRVDSDEAVVYPASVDLSWVDAQEEK